MLPLVVGAGPQVQHPAGKRCRSEARLGAVAASHSSAGGSRQVAGRCRARVGEGVIPKSHTQLRNHVLMTRALPGLYAAFTHPRCRCICVRLTAPNALAQ